MRKGVWGFEKGDVEVVCKRIGTFPPCMTVGTTSPTKPHIMLINDIRSGKLQNNREIQ